MNKKIFIGLAWPYANGSLHLGHASAFIGADIIARYHRLSGDDVLLVSGSDCYGTPIAVEAVEKGIKPSDIADRYHEEFQQSLIEGLGFSYDIYTRTTTEQHAKVVQELFLDLHKKGYLIQRQRKRCIHHCLDVFYPIVLLKGLVQNVAIKVRVVINVMDVVHFLIHLNLKILGLTQRY